MREQRAQTVLLVRSFEEADPEGVLLPLRERTVATRRALMVTGLLGDPGKTAQAWRIRLEEALARRSLLLYGWLETRMPALPRALTAARMGSTAAPGLIGLSLLLGFASNQLGPSHRINLLSLPLLGLVGWNLAVYLTSAVVALGRFERRAGGWLSHRLCEVLFRSALWRRLHSFKIAHPESAAESHVLVRAVVRFGALWHRVAGELLAARVRRLLHLGAAAMALGAVGGMYLRGIGLAYSVTWESTWLEAATVQLALDVLLGPAAWLLGTAVPPVAPWEAPAAGPAGPWIHLWAVTLFLVVVLPRAMLAGWLTWRCQRLAERLPIDLEDAYFRRVFGEWRGLAKRVEILPYSFRPKGQATAALKGLLHDFFGARANVRFYDALEYGADVDDVAELLEQPEDPDDLFEPERCLALVFNLAQTPEREVHGEFAEALLARLDPQRQQLLVLVDGSAYATLDAERVAERQQAWTRVLADSGLEPVHVDARRGRAAGGRVSEELIRAVRRGLWPSEKSLPASG